MTILVGLDDAGIVARGPDVGQQGAALQAWHDAFDVVVVKRRLGSVIQQRCVGVHQMFAPDAKAPARQLQVRMQFRVEALVDQAVFRLHQQAFKRYFRPDIGEDAAHIFPLRSYLVNSWALGSARAFKGQTVGHAGRLEGQRGTRVWWTLGRTACNLPKRD